MKIIRNIIGLFAIAAIAITACKKDNYEAPESMLTGRVVYQSTPIGLRSNGVQLELWQHGYDFFSKIPVYVAQDGSFSARLFDGEYLLTRQRGVGPWADNTDSIKITVKGNTVVDVPVDPYFLVKSAAYQRNNLTVTSTVNIQRVNTTKNLEFVKLYIYKTALVDELNQDAATVVPAANIQDINQQLTITATIPASLANGEAVYARVGVKTIGVPELAYSAPEKIQLK
ncbi:DUF3823 domain-containing protein [Hufsiella arboris]|nr:DUF3823 domain-containing protein [Hufsiella arboris]